MSIDYCRIFKTYLSGVYPTDILDGLECCFGEREGRQVDPIWLRVNHQAQEELLSLWLAPR